MQLDLDNNLPRISGAPSILPGETGSPSNPMLEHGPENDTRARFSLGRIFEATVQTVLIIPFAVVVCAIVAFAVLPLYSGFRWDNLSDGYE
jgi:hypothetical protein